MIILFLPFLLTWQALSFETKTLIFSNGKKIKIELAETSEEKALGLMHRKALAADTGMLFVFPTEQKLSFWMKNTYIPLTIAFFDSQQKLLETKDMQPHLGPISDEQLPHYESSGVAKYALEMSIGWFKKNKIGPGVSFKLQPSPK